MDLYISVTRKFYTRLYYSSFNIYYTLDRQSELLFYSYLFSLYVYLCPKSFYFTQNYQWKIINIKLYINVTYSFSILRSLLFIHIKKFYVDF